MSMFEQTLKRAASRAARRSNRPVAVVVNTGDANSYGVIANLGSEGVPIIAASSDPQNITFRSRYAEPLLIADFEREEAQFIEQLLALGSALNPKPVLFTNGDEILMTLLRHRERLEAVYHLPFARTELAHALTDKTAFYELLAANDVPHAHAFTPASEEALAAIADSLDYPQIIKPSQSQTFSQVFGNKCLQADSPAQLLDLYRKVREHEDEVVIQTRILGTERYLVYTCFSRDSQRLGVAAYRKERIYPPEFGNATVCRTILDEEPIEMTLGLLEKLGYSGTAEAELQRDARDGKFKVVEVNVRTTTQSRLSAACGVNMEYIAYCDVLGEQQSFKANSRADQLWIDLYRDALAVFTSRAYRDHSGIGFFGWLRSLRGRKVFAFCSLRDPRVSLAMIGRVLRVHVFSRLGFGR